MTAEVITIESKSLPARHQVTEVTVPLGGTNSTPVLIASPLSTIALHPGGGGTMTLQITCSLPSKVLAGTARWVNSDDARMVAAAADVFSPVGSEITAVRASAAVADGVMEVCNP